MTRLILLTYLLPRYARKGGLKRAERPHVTTYLGALRGWAAMIVFFFHYRSYLPFLDSWLFQQPFICLLTQGGAMVRVFFVVSGYVLSFRLIKLMRKRQSGPLLDALASSIFRRYIRLYGSAAVASFIGMLAMKFKTRATNTRSLFLAIRSWALDFAKFSNVFASVGFGGETGPVNRYSVVLWTIPVEFRGSIILFLFCAGACKLSNMHRMLLCMSLVCCAYYWNMIYVALFLAGAFLADLSFTRDSQPLGWTPQIPFTDLEKPLRRHQSRGEKLFFVVILLLAPFLLSHPSVPHKDSYWSKLDRLTTKYVYLSFGAILLVWALDSFETLQTPLNWNFSLYLGDISFGIYVMYHPVQWILWEPILQPLRVKLLGNGTWTVLPAFLCLIVCLLWVAEQFTRIDEQIVALGKWLQEKLFIW